MTKLKLGFVSALVVAGLAASLVVQHRAGVQARQRDESLRSQGEILASLSEENQRLSNLVEQTKSARPLSQDQLRELLRLRSQVGQLRQTGTEKSQLTKKNAQLKTAVAESAKQIAEEQAAPNYWPKEQLAPAGFGDPESTMKSLLWAMKSSDLSLWQTSCTPEARAKLEKEWDKHGKTETERMAELKNVGNALTANSTGFRIVEQTQTSPEEAVIKLSFVGEGKVRKFVLRKMENEWRFHDIIFAGQNEPQH